MLTGITHQIESLPQHEGEETADETMRSGAPIAGRGRPSAAQREGQGKTAKARGAAATGAAIAALPAALSTLSQIDADGGAWRKRNATFGVNRSGVRESTTPNSRPRGNSGREEQC